MDFKQNLFSANHRNAMIRRYGYTVAQTATVDDLCFEATMEAEFGKEPDKGNHSHIQHG